MQDAKKKTSSGLKTAGVAIAGVFLYKTRKKRLLLVYGQWQQEMRKKRKKKNQGI